jgi:hypothetical protein
MGAEQRKTEENSGKSSSDTKKNNDVQVLKDVSIITRKRKGTENEKETKNPRKKTKAEPIGEEAMEKMAKDHHMTHSAVSVVSTDCTLYLVLFQKHTDMMFYFIANQMFSQLVTHDPGKHDPS